MSVSAALTKILIDKWDFSGDSNSVSGEISVPDLDETTFQAAALLKQPGLPSATIQHAGYFSGYGAGYIEKELYDRLGSSAAVQLGVVLDTSLANSPCYISRAAWGQQLRVQAQAKELITVEGQWPGMLALKRGLKVYDGTLSAIGAQTSRDFGAGGTAGGDAYIWVKTITGGTTGISVRIEHATSQGGAYSTLGTFANFTAVGAYTVSLGSGTVNRWLRAYVVGLGGATSFVCVVAAAVNGVTQ